jgi:hypothetical protein
LIDANADQETVAARVWAAIKGRLLLAADIGETSGA